MNVLDSTTFPLSGNRLIEASAGTGKTYTITNLYLRLLLGHEGHPPLPVSEILVLTFTIAATEELRTRIRKRIFEARRAFDGGETADPFLEFLRQESADAGRDRKLLSAALQLLDEASIFTIHGFCSRVLADNAFETGTLFDQSLDADRDQLLEMAAQDCFRSEILPLPPISRSIALGLWSSPEQLQQKLKPFLFRFNLTLLPEPRDVSTELGQLADDIRLVKQRWLEDDFPAIIGAAGFNANSRCLSRLAPMTDWCHSDNLVTDLWECWSTPYLNSVIKKAGVVPDHPVIDMIDSILAREEILTQERFNLWHHVTATVKANLERYKVELSQLTLDDLLVKVHEALMQEPTGGWLADSLASRWPVAMIDEFQDTDDIQFDIFSRVYRNGDNRSLFYIGDPKQAIYQFRGADVFTYINAKRQVDPDSDVFSLGTNWRSTPSLIDAVNFLFDQPAIFDNDTDIPFEPVAPAEKDHGELIDRGAPVAPISLFQIAGDSLGSKAQIRRTAMSHAAEEISRLLRGAAAGEIHIGSSPLTAGQIALLVRDKNDARAARDALSERNIRSVYVTLESVFLTETAEDLRVILQAVLEPTNERALRAALAVPLMQSTASEIAAMSQDVTVQQRVLAEFNEYHNLWARLDVATMIERLVFKRQIAQKWFGKQDGERQITNLRHLTELLQARASIAPGMHRLLKWFAREKLAAETVAAEERQLRLESDRDLVQIVTMHASKGLEYDIVMIPMAAFIAQERKDEPCLLHDPQQGSFATLLDFSDNEEHRDIAMREKLAEDMRLLYVGITRAKYKCYLGIPDTRELKRSALGRLLQLEEFDASAVSAHLNATFKPPLFDVSRVETTDVTRRSHSIETQHLIRPQEAPAFKDVWRLHSYTGVTRLLKAPEEQAGADVTPGFGDDETEEDKTVRAEAGQFTRFSFPRGPRAGVALHTLLEHFDFTLPATEQEALLSQCLDRVGLTRNRAEWHQVLAEWLDDITRAPLPDGGSLSEIDRDHRMDEMEFHFPLATGSELVTTLKQHGYLAGIESLGVGSLQGIMTGLIDLVLEYDGKYYLIDYKSNHLGDSTSDYDESGLEAAIANHQYDLQYFIYCVALSRYLATRIDNYNYDTHFGGVYYLFLRGMEKGSKTGVYHDRPSQALIESIDRVLGGAP